jgi:hypothetical protein
MRTTLSYRPAGFKWPLIYLGAAVLCYIILMIRGHSTLPTPASTSPAVSYFDLGCALGIIISLAGCLSNTVFVIRFRYFRKQFEYDAHHLYLKDNNRPETIIPFTDINEIRLSVNNDTTSVRPHRNYHVRFQLNDRDYEATLAVFRNTRIQFQQFTEWAQADNPSLKVTDWNITGEDFFWRLRRRR